MIQCFSDHLKGKHAWANAKDNLQLLETRNILGHIVLLLLAVDIDECGTGRHSCANDTICFNLDGGYDCRCPHGKNCTGDCVHEGKVKHTGQIWVLENDRCSVCSCQVGRNKVSSSLGL